jgi:hypothetical protein
MTDTPTPPPAPAPSPTPAPVKTAPSVKTILTDVEVVLAGVATVGEGVLATLPAGPVHTAVAIGLPIVVALVASLRKLAG